MCLQTWSKLLFPKYYEYEISPDSWLILEPRYDEKYRVRTMSTEGKPTIIGEFEAETLDEAKEKALQLIKGDS